MVVVEGARALRALPAPRGPRVLKARRATKGMRELLAHLVQLAPRALKVPRAP